MTYTLSLNDLKGRMPKIMLCGDSVFGGIIFDNKLGRYCKSSSSVLNRISGDIKAEFKNLCSFGNTTLRMQRSFENKLIKQQPDIVVFELGGNDCNYDWQSIADNPENEHTPNTLYNKFTDELAAMVKSVKSMRKIPIISTLPPLDADRFIKWVSKNNIDAEKTINNWLGGSVTQIYWWQEKYSNAALQIAQEQNCRLLDIRGAFLKQDDYRQFICIDGIHPNDKGHKLMANKIKDFIRENAPWMLKS